MRIGHKLIAAISLICLLSGSAIAQSFETGRFFGEGYTTGNKIYVDQGTYISEGYNYNGKNRLEVKGTFNNTEIRIQTSNNNFSHIANSKKYFISGKKRIFDISQLSGDSIRLVLRTSGEPAKASVRIYQDNTRIAVILTVIVLILLLVFGSVVRYI